LQSHSGRRSQVRERASLAIERLLDLVEEFDTAAFVLRSKRGQACRCSGRIHHEVQAAQVSADQGRGPRPASRPGRLLLRDTKNRSDHKPLLSREALQIPKRNCAGRKADEPLFQIVDARKTFS